MKQKIIIDTDPGKDDALAIILASNSNLFDIKAITTVAGNASIENVTKNARYILKLLGLNIPVYSGEKNSNKKLDSIVQGKNGLSGITNNLKADLTKNAVEKILELIEKNPYEITIVAIGPLTNLAKAIKKSPEIMKKIKRIVIMGGALNVRGNQTKYSEFNFFEDPLAAKVVLDFPTEKILISLDVCNKIMLQISDFEKISNNKVRKFCLKIMKEYIPYILRTEGFNGALMYDPLTVYSLINPSACKFKKLKLSVIPYGINEGQLIEDEKGNEILFVKNIDKIKFKQDFIQILSKEETLLNSKELKDLGEETKQK